MNNAIQWIIYVQNIKKNSSLSSFIATSLFPVILAAFLRQKLVKQGMLFNSKYVWNNEKKQKSQKSTEQKCL